MKPRYPTAKQNIKVLKCLQDANGGWVNGRYFLHTLMLSQFHARIKELTDEYHWPIEPSTFRDEYGYKSYRLKEEEPAQLTLMN